MLEACVGHDDRPFGRFIFLKGFSQPLQQSKEVHHDSHCTSGTTRSYNHFTSLVSKYE